MQPFQYPTLVGPKILAFMVEVDYYFLNFGQTSNFQVEVLKLVGPNLYCICLPVNIMLVINMCNYLFYL